MSHQRIPARTEGGPHRSGSEHIELARVYADLHWTIFPVRRGEKVPAISDWQELATMDTSQHNSWFDREQPPNIGLPTGQPNGFFVVDVDPRNGGEDSFDRLQDEIGQLPETVQQLTPSGGFHLLFRMPTDGDIRSRPLNGYPGIDIKGTGGYIVVAPSVFADRVYAWEESLHPQDHIIADPPESLLQLIVHPRVTSPKSTAPAIIVDGTRNQTLFREACRLRRWGWSTDEINAGLARINASRCRPTLSDDELRKIAESAGRYQPVGSLDLEGNQPALGTFPYTDLGNAERLHHIHGKDLRFCVERKCWYIWQGDRWARGGDSDVKERACAVVRGMLRMVSEIDDSEARKNFLKHQIASERNDRLSAMVNLLPSMPGARVRPNELDTSRHLLNLTNGTFDLDQMQLLPHRRDDLITFQAPVAYRRDATCPSWMKFLDDIFDSDAEVIAFVQRLLGVCLSGDTSIRSLVVFLGEGRNGKSTLIEVMRDILGSYAGDVPPAEIMKAQFTDHGKPTPSLASLPGKRLVTVSETEDGQMLAAGLVKAITGGEDTITARPMYGNPFSFRPQFKLFLITNNLPRISDATSSIWDRVLLLRFPVRIPDGDRGEAPDHRGRIKDPQLADKLRAEREGILNWALQGWSDFRKAGLRPPTVVLQSSEAYRRREDTVGEFFDACLEIRDGAWESTQDLQSAFTNWKQESGATGQWRSVANRFIEMPMVVSAKRSGSRGWSGITLLKPESHGRMDAADATHGKSL